MAVKECILKNALEQSHLFICKAVAQGDTVVDATAGNGHDTVFLAGLVKDSGLVYSFDIQPEAVEATADRLQLSGLAGRVRLIHDGHEKMEHHVGKKVKAVMFNLGYMPGGSRRIITRPDTTLQALVSAMKLLIPGGIITLVVYQGDETGDAEYKSLIRYVSNIDQKQYTVMSVAFPAQKNNPPALLCIEKLP